MTIEQVLLEALQDCITEDGAVAFKQMEPAEMVKNMERRLRTITVIARAAIDKSSQKENIMTTEYTPGPWETSKIGNDYDQYAVYAIDKDINEPICNTVYGRANAQLVATAPELLEALKRLLVEYHQHIPDECECPKVREAADAARAAIDKATE